MCRKVIKELKALGEGSANPKTEAGSGLLGGFSSSSNNFLPWAHPPPILLWGAAELPPKAPTSLKSWSANLPKMGLSRN